MSPRRGALLALLAAAVLVGVGAPARAAGPEPASEPAAGAAKALSMPVTFETEDGWTLKGTLTSAASAESPVVILLHMYRADRTTWNPLVPELVAGGMTVLALDQRAHGQSIRRLGEVVRVRDIPHDAFAPFVRDGVKDVRAALTYLAKQGMATDRVALVGASYGCSVAVLSSDLDGVKALALLSPGTDYFGVPVLAKVRAFAGPLLLVAAEDDPQAARSAREMSEGRRFGTELKLFPSGGHGTNLLGSQPGLAGRIRDFLRRSLGLAPPT